MRLLLTIFFIIIFSQNLNSQVWTYIPKERFLAIDSMFTLVEFPKYNCMTIYNNKLAIRSKSSILEIFDKNNIIDKDTFRFRFTSKEDFNKLVSDTNFKVYWEYLFTIKYDNIGSLWGSTIDFIFNYLTDSIIKGYYRFYKIIDSDSFGLNQRYFHFDKNNTPWMVTYKQGYYEYIYICKLEEDKFIIQDSSIITSTPWSGMTFYYTIEFDKDNRLWQLKVDTVLVYKENKIIDKICFAKDGLGAGIFTGIVINKKNQVFLLTSLLNFFWSSEPVDRKNYEWKLDTTFMSNERKYFPTAEAFYYTYMCIDSSDNIWLTHRDAERLYKYDSKVAKWEVYNIPRPQDNPSSWYIRSIQSDEEGKIWILVGNYGLFILDPCEINKVENRTETEAEGIPDIWIWNVYPNPATDKVRVEFFINKGCEKSLEAGLYNYLGERFLDLKPYFKHDPKNLSGVIEFPTDGIPSGIYFVCLSAGKTRKLKMLVLE